MPKILIVYDCMTGNTESKALAIAKGAEQVSDIEATVKKAEQKTPDDMLDANGIINGSQT